MRDHYAVLGVAATASTSAIRTAYRRLALCLHPDRAGVDSAAAFRQVAAAYEILSDPIRRERYDLRLAGQRGSASDASMPSSSARPKDRISRISGPLRSLLAAGLLRQIDVDAYEVWLSRDEAEAGGYVAINTSAPNQVQHWITIPAGVADGTVLPSVIRVTGIESVLRLRIRTS